MISVELGGEGDLKNQMQENIKKWGGDFNLSGEYHDYNVVKLAEHYMKKAIYRSALRPETDCMISAHRKLAQAYVCFVDVARSNTSWSPSHKPPNQGV